MKRLKTDKSKITSAYGIHISGVGKSPMCRLMYWMGYFRGGDFRPIDITMPCGEVIIYYRHCDVPVKDVPCPCGDPNHWLIKYGD